jgi:hypothetical protein
MGIHVMQTAYNEGESFFETEVICFRVWSTIFHLWTLDTKKVSKDYYDLWYSN